MTEERIYQKYYDDLSADEVDLLVLTGLTVRLYASVLDGYYLPKFVEAFKALGLMFYGVEKDSCGMLKATFFISAYYIFKAELDKGEKSDYEFVRKMAQEVSAKA